MRSVELDKNREYDLIVLVNSLYVLKVRAMRLRWNIVGT